MILTGLCALAWGAALPPRVDGVGLLALPVAEVEIAPITTSALPERIGVPGPFRLSGVLSGVRSYEARLPVRTRALFFDKPPIGMQLRQKGRLLSYGNDVRSRSRAGTWEFTADSVVVRVKPEAPIPAPGELTIEWPDAKERESALFPGTSGKTGAEFSLRSAQVNEETRDGALLPAPSSIGWDVPVPEGGVLSFEAGIIPAEIFDGRVSDGADLTLTVDGAEIAHWRVASRGFDRHVVDLGAYGGRRVRVRFASADGNQDLDHVFVTDPRVYVPQDKPQRVVLVFIDTLRRDHLGTYGYKRDTTPFLDAWAKDNIVFDDARTLAPWTLPSTRTLETGRAPEFWSESTRLQTRLAAKGWATGAWVGNVYLSQNFEMGEDWGFHSCTNWPGADYEVWNGRRFLKEHERENTLMMVHFMDMHLPYKEPLAYQKLFVKKTPPGLDGMFNRTTLMRLAMNNRETIRRYLLDRYDQNLRFIDDQLSKMLPELDDAVVVVFADHGEEFFDHGNLEHGHTLYDELLRIPMMMHIPGVGPRRVPDRVTLMDLSPTLLELLGIDEPKQDGMSLVKLAEEGTDPRFLNRLLGFGRTLYNGEAWGSLAGDQKYISNSGREQLYDIKADPGEMSDLAAKGASTQAARAAMATSLDRPVDLAFRLNPSGRPNKDYTVRMHVPGGIKKAWIGDDPTKVTSCTMETIDADTVQFSFLSLLPQHREAFVVPNRPADEVAPEVTVSFVVDPAETNLGDNPDDGSGNALARLRKGGRTLIVNYAVLPEPVGEATNAANTELGAALEALGYLNRDDPAAAEEPEAPEAP